jgi:two-component system, OmpR family, sensor kinase
MIARLSLVGGLRGRLLASVMGGIGLLLAALTIAFNLVLAQRLDGDANGVVQARAVAGLSSLTVGSGRIRLADAPDERSPDAQLWVFQGATALEQPRAAPVSNSRAATTLAALAPASRDVRATRTRLYALPVVQSGRRLGAVVAGLSLTPYDQTRHTALVASIVLAIAVFAAVALAAAWLISKALSPVGRMTRQAAEWSEHHLDQRFSLGPPRDELTQLASTLDTLLDRLATSLRHEQRLSAELSHELRTPLASIVAGAQYALRHAELSAMARECVEQILQSAQRMARTLDTLIAAARAQLDPHRSTSDAAACARAALDACVDADSGEVRASVRVARPGIRVAVERDLVERILAPLIENALRHANERVELAVTRGRASALFTVTDDGAGVAEHELEAIFEPGRRADASATATLSTGAGLGLALARRLARSAGGDVCAGTSDHGGHFTVRLPSV